MRVYRTASANNFMTTTCRIVVIKIVGWRELNPLPQYIACQV